MKFYALRSFVFGTVLLFWLTLQAALAAPVISSISPNPVPGLDGSQTITLTGTNFVSGCQVTLYDVTNGDGPYVKSVTYVSSSQIKVSANFTNNTATWSAQVTSPTASNTKNFTVQVSGAAPVITSISPSPVPGLDGTQTITISGSNFVSGCTLTLKDLTNGGTYAKSVTYVSSSQIKVSANFTNNTATWSAQVTSPTASNTKNFSVQASVVAPVISSIGPDPVPGLDGTQTITISGSNFVSGCTLTLKDLTNGGTYVKSVTYVSSSQIKVSANFTNNTATWSAQVTSPTTSNTKNFTVQVSGAAPVITSISPSPVPGLDGSQTITLSGTNFVAGCTVTLKDLTNGGTYPKSVNYVSSSQIKISANFTNATATWSAQVTAPTVSNTKTFSVQAAVVTPGSFTLSNDSPVWDTQTPAGPAVRLRWTASSNAASYDLYRNGSLYKSGLAGTSFYNSTGLSTGQTYTYYLIAKNSVGIQQSNSVMVGPMPGEAPRPDLIIVSNSVTFSPATVNVGNSFTLSFTVKNLGPGNAPATIARLRLSADAVLTKYDLPLSPLDVGIPNLSAGASYTFNQLVTVPSSTPKGQYYVGAFADADDSAGQSDVTNDPGLSVTRLSVTAPGIAAPIITSQPVGVTVNAGKTAQFSVKAQGTDLKYKWFRYENEVGNETPVLNLVGVGPSQAGEYWVRVSNAGDPVDSNHVFLTVTDTTPPAQNPLGSGSFTPYGTFNPSLPTVVITHGWQKDGEFDIDNPPSWMMTMKQSINSRLNRENYWPADNDGNRANILLFTWPDAFFKDPWLPFASTDYEGQQLANYLKPLIGGTYSKPVHFIGHSFGTFVNAHAVEKLGIEIDQFTILDAPISAEAQGLLYNYWLGSFFSRHLSRKQVTWVDNYIANIPTFFGLSSAVFGDRAEGAFPNGGLVTEWTHTTIQEGFYLPSIQGYIPNGFNDSVLLNPAGLGVHLQWNPPPSFSELVSELPDVARFAAGEIHGMVDTVKGKALEVIQMMKTASSLQSNNTNGIKSAANPSKDAVLEFDLTVPKRAQQLTFDFRFAQLGDGDWMTVSFNDNLLYNFLGKSFYGTDYHQAEIPIANYAGKTGVLTVALHSANATPSELRVGNFKFMAAASGSLKVFITPTQAADAGAKWRVDDGPWKSSGTTQENLPVGEHKVTFGSIKGWGTPNSQTVSITASKIATVTGIYKAFPEIAVKLSQGNELENRSSTVRFGNVKLKKSISKKFTIKNTGTAILKGISISKSGPHKSNFTISHLAHHTLAPGVSMSFKVTFMPSTKGVREAAIYIASNDSNENPFTIWLKGTGKTSASSKEPAALAEMVLKDIALRRNNLLEYRSATRSMTLADRQRYLNLTVEKIPGTEPPVVEVSPDLVNWHSGSRHTTIIRNDDEILKVRDDIPFTADNKRYIRTRPHNKR